MPVTAIPAEIEDLCVEHDRVFDDIKFRADSLLGQANDVVDRESAQELASSLDGIADDLRDLLVEKDRAGYFTGGEEADANARERAEHQRSDQRRLISGVQSVAREFRTGKSSKARRQLASWVSKFNDAGDREVRCIAELWGNQ